MKRKPDLMVVFLAIFGLALVITLMVPDSSSHTALESALQAGVLVDYSP